MQHCGKYLYFSLENNTCFLFFCSFSFMLFEYVFQQKKIDSGFFPYEAVKKRKKEKKHKIDEAKLGKKCRNLKDFMEPSDGDFFPSLEKTYKLNFFFFVNWIR